MSPRVSTITGLRPGRRMVLRGLGTAIALPWLELSHAQAAPAVRLFTWFWTNGTRDSSWFPSSGAGPLSAATLGTSMAALKAAPGETDILPYLNVVGGVTDTGKLWTAGHSCAMFAAGESDGDNRGGYGEWPKGASIDQICADKLGAATRFPSMAFSGGGVNNQTGRAILSWQAGGRPVQPTDDPKALFKKLFSAGTPAGEAEATRTMARRKSVLDAAQEDAQRLRGRIGTSDRLKVDEHLAAIRAVEKELTTPAMPGGAGAAGCASVDSGPFDRGKLSNVLLASDREPLMLRLMVLAMRCDLVRYGSFMLDCASGQKSYPDLGSPGHDHDLSHNAPDDQIIKRTNVKLSYLATFLRDMAAVKEGDVSLLDNAIIYSNSEIFDGQKHSREHLPIIVAGRAGGALKTGRFLQYGANGKPLSDLLSSLLNHAGVPTGKFGTVGTGPLSGF